MDGMTPAPDSFQKLTSTQVNRLNVVEQLLQWRVDGIITDCTSRLTAPTNETSHRFCIDPNVVRRLVKQNNLPAAPKYPKQRVLACLDKHLLQQRS